MNLRQAKRERRAAQMELQRLRHDYDQACKALLLGKPGDDPAALADAMNEAHRRVLGLTLLIAERRQERGKGGRV